MKTIVRKWRDDSGAATAEYAIATMAAVGFAGLLVVILKGDGVRGLLTNIITGALGIGG
jgi:Flp pilus assembly pilin Flp